MEQLNDYILDAVITLRQKKKQPNEDSILNILTSKMESLTKTKLDSQRKQQRIYNKPYCGNNSYYVCEQVDNSVPTEKPLPLALSKKPLEPSIVSLESPKDPSKISLAIPPETPLTEPLMSPKNAHTVI